MPSIDMGAEISLDSRIEPAHRIIIAILALAMPVFAIVSGWQNFGSDELRVAPPMIIFAEVAMIAALAFPTFKNRTNRSPNHQRLNMILAVAFAASAGVSTAFAHFNPELARFHYGATLMHMALGWMLLQEMRRSPTFANCLLPSIAVGLTLFALVVFCYVLLLGDVSIEVSKFVGAAVTNVRHVGYYIAALFGIGSGLYLKSYKEVDHRRFWAAIIFVSIFVSLWLGGRGAFLSILGTLILLVWLAERPQAMRLLLLCVGAFLISIPLAELTAPNSPYYGPSAIFGRLLPGSTDIGDLSPGRIELWGQAIRMIGEHPLFGLGEGQYRFALEGLGSNFNQPHNLFLQLLVQWGVIGTFLFSAWIGAIASRQGYKDMRKQSQFFAAAGALIGLLLLAMVDGPFFTFYPLIIAIIAFLYLICDQGKNEPGQV